MFEEARLVFLHALTPAHPGTGQAVGVIDLPIQREAHTHLPVVQASGVKGAWRDRKERQLGEQDRLVQEGFGPPTQQAHEYAGALAFTDARLLAFPVRSALGLVAWVTSRFAWERFVRDAQLVGLAPPAPPTIGAGRVSASGPACIGDDSVLLEAYRFPAVEDEAARGCGSWLVDRGAFEAAAGEFVRERLLFVEDDLLRDLTVHGAEVVARIALGKDGTTSGEGGGPWYEELIPSDALFYLLAFATEGRREVNGTRTPASELIELVAMDDGEVVQIGGEATIGRGLFRVRVLGKEGA